MTTTYDDYNYQSGDGLNLYARIYGARNSDKTILCLPGLTRNSADFDLVAPHLAKKYRVVAMDLRGRGNSQWDPKPENYIPQIYVQDVYQLMASLGLEKVALIGTSLGGIISMILSSLTPEKVQGVVINDIGPEVDVAGIDRIKSYVGGKAEFETWEELALRCKDMNGAFFPDATDDEWMHMAKRTGRRLDDGRIIFNYDPALAAPFKASNENPEKFDMWSYFDALKGKPLLTIRGALSDLFSQDTFDKMAMVHGGMDGHIIANMGHAPMMDDAASLKALDQWAAKVFE